MPDQNQVQPTIPEQPEAKPPLRKGAPLVIALIVIVALIGLANISSLLSGNKKATPQSALTMRPSAPNAQQVTSFETQQQVQARRDMEERQRQQLLAAQMQQLQQKQSVPGPESPTAPAMTPAQRSAIYGDSPNTPQRTSGASEAQAQAKQKALASEKQRQDALNSIPSRSTSPMKRALLSQRGRYRSPLKRLKAKSSSSADLTAAVSAQPKVTAKADPMSAYDLDQYQGCLFTYSKGRCWKASSPTT